jgi:hypothetical protein
MKGFPLIIPALLFSAVCFGQAETSPKKQTSTAGTTMVQPLKFKSKNARKADSGAAEFYAPSPAADAPESDVEADSKSSTTAANMQPLYWLNQFQAKRNALLSKHGTINAAGKRELENVVWEAGSYIKTSFEWNYMNLRLHRNDANAADYLKQAVQLKGVQTLLFPEMAWIAERNGAKAERQQALKEMERQGAFSEIQLEQARWMIQQVPARTLIITHGENDTYPLWLLQNQNIEVLSLAMIEDRNWLLNTLKRWDGTKNWEAALGSEQKLIQTLLRQASQPVYLSLSIDKEILAPNIQNLYPVGNLARLSASHYDAFPELFDFYLNPGLKAKLSRETWRQDPFRETLANLQPGAYLLKKELERRSDQASISQLEQLNKQLSALSGKPARP